MSSIRVKNEPEVGSELYCRSYCSGWLSESPFLAMRLACSGGRPGPNHQEMRTTASEHKFEHVGPCVTLWLLFVVFVSVSVQGDTTTAGTTSGMEEVNGKQSASVSLPQSNDSPFFILPHHHTLVSTKASAGPVLPTSTHPASPCHSPASLPPCTGWYLLAQRSGGPFAVPEQLTQALPQAAPGYWIFLRLLARLSCD